MTRLALVLLLLLSPALQAQTPQVTLDAPRANGWWVGDVITLTAEVEVPRAFTLDPAALPRPRAVSYWLDLRELEISDRRQGDMRKVTLRFDYQIFYVALDPREQTIPPVTLRFVGPDGDLLARIPGFSMVVSPLRPILAPTTLSELAPLRPVRLVSPRPARQGLVAGGALALAGVAGLLWHLGLGPFHRADRPFTRAARDIARRMRRDGAQDTAAWLRLHRAFDAVFGRRMMAGDVDGFVAAHPAFAPAHGDIAPFFHASEARFFGRGAPDWTTARLGALAARLGRLERSRP